MVRYRDKNTHKDGDTEKERYTQRKNTEKHTKMETKTKTERHTHRSKKIRGNRRQPAGHKITGYSYKISQRQTENNRIQLQNQPETDRK